MNWRKTTATAVLALVVVFCMAGCPTKPPATPNLEGPDSTWTFSDATFRVWTTAPTGNIRYVMDWTDKTDTTELSYASAETARVTHVWEAVGTYDVKAMAILDAEPAKASDWSPTKSVNVLLNQRPVVDSVSHPPVAVKGAPTLFTLFGNDPDGDSLRAIVKWGSKDTTTELFPNPLFYVQVNLDFGSLGDATVIVWMQDSKGARSLPDTIVIPVGTAGGLHWLWMNSEEGGCYTSAIVATDLDMDEVVMTSSDDYTFVSIRTSNGNKKDDEKTDYLEYDFTGHPGYNAVLGHIIVGSDEGELYALSIDGLKTAWRFPNISPEDSLTWDEWGAPAFSAQNIYIGHDDTIGQLVLIQDAGTQGNQVAAYNAGTGVGVNDAPVVDAQGNVIFATNDGRLTKIDANLSSPIWTAQLLGNGDVYGPILGSDGTIYCTSDSARLYAIEPDSGFVKSGWPVTLDAEASRPALGQTALFIGDLLGAVYSINPATGAINWKKTVSDFGGFTTTPIVTDSGIVYFADEEDVLFCVNQSDGTAIWSCDCPYYLPFKAHNPHRPKKLDLTGYLPNPSICANGDIIVVGSDALYCVYGYQEATLDAAAPWPKWQKDLSNSGK
jgi:outer membrane protein assembly factor BamB